jgi:transposase
LETVKVPRYGHGRPQKRPLRLIADKGYDSDPLRKRLKAFKIDLIVPQRNNRKKLKLQDGTKLRRYRKRWKIERTFAWLVNYRRLLVRHERRIDMYRAFFHIACLIIVLIGFEMAYIKCFNRSKTNLLHRMIAVLQVCPALSACSHYSPSRVLNPHLFNS